GFVNLAGGDFRLAAASPFANAGSDGKDPGVDTEALTAARASASSPPVSSSAGSSPVSPPPAPPVSSPPDPPATAATTTAISAPAVTYPSGAQVTVTVSASAGTPSGTVSLMVDTGATLTAPLSNGQAQFTVPNPSTGVHTLTASYGGVGSFGASGATG